LPGPVAGFNNPNNVKVGLAASPTNSAGQMKDVDIPLAADMYETTIMSASGWKTFLAGLKTGLLNLKMNYDHTDTNGQVVIETAFINGTLLFFIVSPNNNVNTYTFTAFVKDYKIHDPVNNIVELDGAFQISGSVVVA